MILSSQLLDTHDRCPRRYAFERTHEPRTISPLGLLYAAVEGSLTAPDPCEGARDAIMERTSRLQIDSGNDLSPISSLKHIEATAEVMALALRERLGRAQRVEPVPLGEHVWQSNLFECRGEAHRIILASHIDDDSLRSFAHAWQTVGELAALERRITLTAVVIGAQRGGRRHSPWSKGFLHPIQKTLRVARRKANGADGFTSGWKDVWREQTDIKAEAWLARMKADEALSELIVSRPVNYRGEDARMLQVKAEIPLIATDMVRATTQSPMRRSSCDEIGRGACFWQACCYSPTPAGPEDLPHLYRLRETPREAPGSETCLDHNACPTP